MRILHIEIDNYKSLRHVVLDMPAFMAIVGQNAAGKSNFADALDFAAEVYRHGLEIAVARKGGYENICFRKTRRSKSPIRFKLLFQVQASDAFPWHAEPEDNRPLYIEHSYMFKAETQAIRASFAVSDEHINMGFEPNLWDLMVSRTDGSIDLCTSNRKNILTERTRYAKKYIEEHSAKNLGGPSTSLVFETLSYFLPFPNPSRLLGSLHVYQLFPPACREPGIPTPNPELSRFGANLPATVDMLSGKHRNIYDKVLNYMRLLMPSLDSLETSYTHRRTLGLSFAEKGIPRAWSIEDVSDGTVQILAILIALYDPRHQAVVIEEPENSLHPWMLREVVMPAVQDVAQHKQVILTTHSPVLIDMVKPCNLYIAYRYEHATCISPALSLDHALDELWRGGEISLAQYLDSGFLPEAVPGGED
jgi:predicted ATPase